MTHEDGVAIPPTAIIVVGAGAIGLTLGIGLARAGFAVTVIGPKPAPRPGRTVALLDGSVRLLQVIGAWAALLPHAAPMRAMRIVDDTGSLFRTPPVTFEAREIGLPVFGFNIVNDDLERSLRATAESVPGLALVSSFARRFDYGASEVTVTLDDGSEAMAALLIAADGRQSLARKTAGIGVRAHDYPQVALTATLDHTASHRDVSTEFHTRRGPFTLVPLLPAESKPFRSSLVWVMSPQEARRRLGLSTAALAAEIERQSQRLLGSIRIDGAVGSFPIATSVSARLTAPRLALAGEAAHALPPIGAQGLNLSLRDVGMLVDTLSAARDRGKDPGDSAVLADYAAARRSDVALRAFGVDALNGSLLSHNPIMDLVRGTGLNALGSLQPLRRWVMRQGLAPDAPSLQADRTPQLDARAADRRSNAPI